MNYTEGTIMQVRGYVNKHIYTNPQSSFHLYGVRTNQRGLYGVTVSLASKLWLEEGFSYEFTLRKDKDAPSNNPKYKNERWVVVDYTPIFADSAMVEEFTLKANSMNSTLDDLTRLYINDFLKSVDPEKYDYFSDDNQLKLGMDFVSFARQRTEEKYVGNITSTITGTIWRLFENVVISVISRQFVAKHLYNELTKFGLSKSKASQLANEHYQGGTLDIQKDPYVLMYKFGETFELADSVASQTGIKHDSELRKGSAVYGILKDAENNGHIYLTLEGIQRKIDSKLSVVVTPIDYKENVKTKFGKIACKHPLFIGDVILASKNTVEETKQYVEYAVALGIVTVDNDKIYITENYKMEKKIAEFVKSSNQLRKINIEHEQKIAKDISEKYKLGNKQSEAISKLLESKHGLFILNGSAGTGKTYCIKAALEAMSIAFGYTVEDILLLAPTGRAAQIISDKTGYKGKTIHSALEYDPEQLNPWGFSEKNQLDKRLVIVDETSMLNNEICYRLLDALSVNCKVVFLGDTKQLQSIGAGNILHDLINSGRVETVTLDVIQRQLEGSDIIRAANCVIDQKEMVKNGVNKDMFYMQESNSESITNKVIKSINKIKEITKDRLFDIKVLSPYKDGLNGTKHLNHIIQKEFNKQNKDSEIILEDYAVNDKVIPIYLRVGDIVLHTKNNAKAPWLDINGVAMGGKFSGVMNGEIGEVVNIKAKEIVVKYDDHFIVYPYSIDFNIKPDLIFAYAITTHKAQGSQWSSCIVVAGDGPRIMMNNSNLYTMITRASNFLAMIGYGNMIDYAIQNNKVDSRNTSLKDWLRN